MTVMQVISGGEQTSWATDPVLAQAFDVFNPGGLVGPIIDLSGGEAGFIAAGEGANVIVSGSGPDTIEGGGGNDLILGGGGDDVLSGGAGQDGLDGGTGSDIVLGGPDGDTLYGGSDDAFDRLIGGTDGGVRDVFRIDAVDRNPGESTNGRYDTVENFEPGVDVIDVRGAGVATVGDLLVSDLGTDILVTAQTDGSTFLILGQSAADLDPTWFAFAGGA